MLGLRVCSQLCKDSPTSDGAVCAFATVGGADFDWSQSRRTSVGSSSRCRVKLRCKRASLPLKLLQKGRSRKILVLRHKLNSKLCSPGKGAGTRDNMTGFLCHVHGAELPLIPRSVNVNYIIHATGLSWILAYLVFRESTMALGYRPSVQKSFGILMCLQNMICPSK